MTIHRKKILLAVDGSNQSMDVVRYAGQIFSGQRVDIHLFHVLSPLPELFYDLGIEPALHQSVLNIQVWESALQDAIHAFIKKAIEVLVASRIPQEAVSTKIQERKKGIARDLLRECRQGYDAVMLGRTGLGAFRGLILGSVTNKLLEKSTDFPICVVGESPDPGKWVYAMDDSTGALKAVETVSTLLGASSHEILLLHVLRDLYIFQPPPQDLFTPDSETHWMEAARHKMAPAFEKAACLLTAAGFDLKQIQTKILKGMHSRAAAIVHEADRGGCGTIVVGRRGISRVHEFLMGRVGSKLIQLAKRQAIWVVG